jgi:hypothetical protein
MEHKLHQNNLVFNVLDKKYKLGMILFGGNLGKTTIKWHVDMMSL